MVLQALVLGLGLVMALEQGLGRLDGHTWTG